MHFTTTAVLAVSASATLVAALPYATPKRSLSLPFSRRAVHPASYSGSKRLARRQVQESSSTLVETPLLNLNDMRYLASAQIGGQDLVLMLDTGSSDTFVYGVQPDEYQDVPEAELPPLFDNSTAVGVSYLDIVYNASYGEGNGITNTLGAVGVTTLSLNGTEIAADNLTFANLYDANGGTGGSGLIGLGFPLASNIFMSVLQANDASGNPLSPEQAQAYYSLVPLLHYQKKIDQPMFSMVIDKLPIDLIAPANVNAINYTYGNGSLTLGDYPEGFSESDFTFSPVPVVRVDDSATEIGIPAYTGIQWTTPLENVYFNGKRLKNTTEKPHARDEGGHYWALVDSGNPGLNFPEDMMKEITRAWAANPNNHTIPCESPFELTLQFAGKNFTLAKEDVLVPSYIANDGVGAGGFAYKDCQFQAQPAAPSDDVAGPGTGQTYALGDPFLRNVAAVFDFGNLLDSRTTPPRMGFAQR